MSCLGHRPSGSSRRAAGDCALTSAEHRYPEVPGPFHGHPVRGLPLPDPEHLPSCPEPLARLRALRAAACVRERSLEAHSARTLSPCRHSGTLARPRRFFPARHSLGSSTREPAPEGCQDTSDRRLPPKSLYPTAPVLSSLGRLAGLSPGPSEKLVGSRPRACFGGTARGDSARFSLTALVTICAADVPVVTLCCRAPASQPNARTQSHRGMLASIAVTRCPLPLPRTPSAGVDSSACSLREEPPSAFTLSRLVSNPGSFGGTPPRSAGGFVRHRRLVPTRRCARGFPTRLASAHVTRGPHGTLRVALLGGRNPNIQLLPYVFRRTGTPTGALHPPPREVATSVRVRRRRPGLRRARASAPSVISARARSHTVCDLPCDRSLGRRSREAPLTLGAAY